MKWNILYILILFVALASFTTATVPGSYSISKNSLNISTTATVYNTSITWTNPTWGATQNQSMTSVVFNASTGVRDSTNLTINNLLLTIPSDAVIDGIQVLILNASASSASAPRISIKDIYLVNGSGVIGAMRRNETLFPATPGTNMTIGGVADMWGTVLAPKDVNQTAFGIRLRLNKTNSTTARTGFIDGINVTIYYHIGCVVPIECFNVTEYTTLCTGNYSLKGNVCSTSAPHPYAIKFIGDNKVLDCNNSGINGTNLANSGGVLNEGTNNTLINCNIRDYPSHYLATYANWNNKIKNINFRGNASEGDYLGAIYLDDAGQGTIIDNCTFNITSGQTINSYEAGDVIISNNNFIHGSVSNYGGWISLSGATNTQIINNIMGTATSDWGTYQRAMRISYQGWGQNNTNMTIAGNQIYGASNIDVQTILIEKLRNSTFANNTISITPYSWQSTVGLYSPERDYFINNTFITGNKPFGLYETSTFYDGTYNQIYFYNNTYPNGVAKIFFEDSASSTLGFTYDETTSDTTLFFTDWASAVNHDSNITFNATSRKIFTIIDKNGQINITNLAVNAPNNGIYNLSNQSVINNSADIWITYLGDLKNYVIGYFPAIVTDKCIYGGTGQFLIWNASCNITSNVTVQSGFNFTIINGTIYQRNNTWVKNYKTLQLISGWLHLVSG